MKKKIISGVYLGLLFIATLILVFEKSEDIYPALIAVGVFGVIFGLVFFCVSSVTVFYGLYRNTVYYL